MSHKKKRKIVSAGLRLVVDIHRDRDYDHAQDAIDDLCNMIDSYMNTVDDNIVSCWHFDFPYATDEYGDLVYCRIR